MKNRTFEIYETIKQRKYVTVEELAEAYNVTRKTIRIDLTLLEDAKLISRTHGGAMLNENVSEIFPGGYYNSRSSHQKQEIALKALEFIKPDSTIILDDGTTNQAIARVLPDKPLTVITNDFYISLILSKKPAITKYFVGGKVRDTYGTTMNSSQTGEYSARELGLIKQLEADIFFVGTNAINPTNGFMVFNEFVLAGKNAFRLIARRSICVADAGKFDKAGFYRFASFKDINTVITDSTFNKYRTLQYAKKGLNIIIADPLKDNGEVKTKPVKAA